MTNIKISTAQQQTQAQIGRREASAPGKVTGRLKTALDLMIWQNVSDNQAAVKTGITVTAIRLALKRPHVVSYFRAQLQVLDLREQARNKHTLIEVRDQKSNQMARVVAVKEMRQADDEPVQSVGRAQAPGVVIQILNSSPEPAICDVSPQYVTGQPEQDQ